MTRDAIETNDVNARRGGSPSGGEPPNGRASPRTNVEGARARVSGRAQDRLTQSYVDALCVNALLEVVGGPAGPADGDGEAGVGPVATRTVLDGTGTPSAGSADRTHSADRPGRTSVAPPVPLAPVPAGAQPAVQLATADACRPGGPRDGETRYQRVLWIEPGGALAVVIDVAADAGSRLVTAQPRWVSVRSLLEGLLAEHLIVQPTDPFAPPPSPVLRQPEKHLAIRDRRWSVIGPLVADPAAAFDDRRRAAFVAGAARAGTSAAKVRQWLREYWQRGQCANALLPKWTSPSGAREPGANKSGRRKRIARQRADRNGVQPTLAERRTMAHDAKVFIERKGLSRQQAYWRMLRRRYAAGTRVVPGRTKPSTVLLPKHQRPTYGQFLYAYQQSLREPGRAEEALRATVGPHNYDKDHRPAIGSATEGVVGPGSRFEVDATVGDIYLLSGVVEGQVIGRPVIYVVRDTFSRLIVGLHVGLRGPSWEGMALALENAFSDKVAYCARFGRVISDALWPARHGCDTLLGDRGELISTHADRLGPAFGGMTVSNAASYRADWKAIVENAFKVINDRVLEWQPGHVYDRAGRGSPDYRLDAQYTLRTFTQLMIGFVLRYNTKARLRGSDVLPLDFPLPVSGDPTPLDLWRWGLKHRNGTLRRFDPATVRANLLPGGEARVDRGLVIGGLHYWSSALPASWLHRRTGAKPPRVRWARDPRDVSLAYALLDEGRRAVPLELLRGDRRFAGCSAEEVEDARVRRAIGNQADDVDEDAEGVEFIEEVEALLGGERAALPRVGDVRAARRAQAAHDDAEDVARRAGRGRRPYGAQAARDEEPAANADARRHLTSGPSVAGEVSVITEAPSAPPAGGARTLTESMAPADGARRGQPRSDASSALEAPPHAAGVRRTARPGTPAGPPPPLDVGTGRQSASDILAVARAARRALRRGDQ